MSFAGLRRIFPAVLDTLAYSCQARKCSSISQCIRIGAHRLYSSSTKSENEEVNLEFVNRNPRNLERMAIARKPKGWSLHYPSPNYYHRLRFEKTNRHVTGWIEHNSGKVIVTASSKEFAIAKHLYSLNDLSAAENIGRVLARRCLEAGIECTSVLEPEIGRVSEKFQMFLDAVSQGGVELCEPEEVVPHYEPGIDYDDEWAVADLKRRQQLAANVPMTTVFKYGARKRDYKKEKKSKSH